MTIADVAARAGDVQWIVDGKLFKTTCSICPGGTVTVSQVGATVTASCSGGCKGQEILGALAGSSSLPQDAQQPPKELAAANGNGHHKPKPRDFGNWQLEVGYLIKRALDDVPQQDRAMIASMGPEKLADILAGKVREMIDGKEPPLWPLPDLTATELEEEVGRLALKAAGLFCEAYQRRKELPAPELAGLPVETLSHAIEANQRYLEREPVIENLLYASATSMVTGGKHSGKSTLARYLAICVAKGSDFLDRKVQQGAVIYLASEDEEMVARAELIRLGWTQNDPIFFVGKSQIAEDLDEEAILKLLALEVEKRKAKLVVVDMLFDFIPVRDELGYAETRRAVGLLQRVSSVTGVHIICLHHAPKHMSLSANAAITALGSMGLAARVSPIILTRRYGPGVHAIISTEVRDPRGQPFADSRLLLRDDGSMELGGHFKAYMLAEVHADRVFDLISGEAGQEFTINDVMEQCALEYEPARATLKFLWNEHKINRDGNGKKRSPFRYSIPLTEISPTNDSDAQRNTPQGGGTRGKKSTADFEAQGGFGYKENLPKDDPSDLDEYGISRSR